MEDERPKRKHPRLNNYDYSACGAYFVTLCTQNKKCILSRVVEKNIEKTPFGEIAERFFAEIEKRYAFIRIKQYVIMPNHIHFILFMEPNALGTDSRPTLSDIVRAYKSLVTAACKKVKPIDKVFQTSFYEHIIRNRQDYDDISRYIKDNPARWYYDKLYNE